MTVGRRYERDCFTGGERLRRDLDALLTERNAVLIGAPSVGKTHECARLVDEHDDVVLVHSAYERAEKAALADEFGIAERVYGLDELDAIGEADRVVLDDFYTVVEECVRRAGAGEPGPREQVLELLGRDRGVCVSTTPYRWNTLLGVPHEAAPESSLVDTLISAKARLLGDGEAGSRELPAGPYTAFARRLVEAEPAAEYRFLCYRDEQHARDALEAAQSGARTRAVDADAIPPYSASVAFPDGQRAYDTRVPFVLFLFNREVAADLLEETEESIKVLGHIKGGSRVEDALHGLAGGGHGSGPMATLLALGGEATFGVGLGVLLHLTFGLLGGTEGPPERVESLLGGLADLTPPQMEVIEREAGLEPLTIEGLQSWLGDPTAREELARSVEANRETLEAVRTDLGLEGLAVFDEADRAVLSGLGERIRANCTISDVLAVRIERAVRPPERPLWRRLAGPVRFLDGADASAPADWGLVEPPVVEALEARLADPPADRRLAEALETADRVPGLVLTGPVGSGKTTAAYALARRLVDAGHFVALADLAELGTVEFVLEQVDEPAVLVVEDFNEVPERAAVGLLELVVRGLCETVVFTTRSDAFSAVDAEMRDALDATGLARERLVWDSAATDHRVGIDGLPRGAFESLLARNYPGLAEGDRERVWSLAAAGGAANPLLAVLAADAMASGVDPAAHEDAGLLVWEQLAPLFAPASWERELDAARGVALTAVAGAGELDGETLSALLAAADVEVGLEAALTACAGYLSPEPPYTLEPPLLRTIVVRAHLLGGEPAPLTAEPYALLERFAERGMVPALARQLAEAGADSAVRAVAPDVLAAADGPAYADCLRAFVEAGQPPAPDALDAEALAAALPPPGELDGPPRLLRDLWRAYGEADRAAFRPVVEGVSARYADRHDGGTEAADWGSAITAEGS